MLNYACINGINVVNIIVLGENAEDVNYIQQLKTEFGYEEIILIPVLGGVTVGDTFVDNKFIPQNPLEPIIPAGPLVEDLRLNVESETPPDITN
jgi:hypothetical protein